MYIQNLFENLQKIIKNIITKFDDETPAIILKKENDLFQLKISIKKETSFNPYVINNSHAEWVNHSINKKLQEILYPLKSNQIRSFEIDVNYETTTFTLKLNVIKINNIYEFNSFFNNTLQEIPIIKIKQKQNIKTLLSVIKEYPNGISLSELAYITRKIPNFERKNLLNQMIYDELIREEKIGEYRKKGRLYFFVKDFESEKEIISEFENLSLPKSIIPDNPGKNEIELELFDIYIKTIRPIFKEMMAKTNRSFMKSKFNIKISHDEISENITVQVKQLFGNVLKEEIVESSVYTGKTFFDIEILDGKIFIEVEFFEPETIEQQHIDFIQNYFENYSKEINENNKSMA